MAHLPLLLCTRSKGCHLLQLLSKRFHILHLQARARLELLLKRQVNFIILCVVLCLPVLGQLAKAWQRLAWHTAKLGLRRHLHPT